MKDDLTKHIAEIFNSLGLNDSFEVFDCCHDKLPQWTKYIQVTHEFIVCCQNNSLKQRLQVFIGKNILEKGEHLYWFEGEQIIEQDSFPINEQYKIENEKIEYLKSDTRLPAYIDDFIFNHLNAIYAPDFQRFEYNLDLTGEEIRKYLGTYFPRSYAESFCIFDNIFQNRVYQETITNKKSLNILSVGCGTGGDIIGLITAIEKHFFTVSEINIWAIDGNKEALAILEQIVDKVKVQSSKKITLKTTESVINSISDFIFENPPNSKFDFILSFKFVCEIIAMGKGRFDYSYSDFVIKFLPMLSSNGLCVLLDVTTKPKHNTYNPILMNKQVNQALRALNEFKTLLPTPCSVYSDKCLCDCFQQKTFTVTHSKHSNDKSRVSYRILLPIELKEKFNFMVKDTKQLINNEKTCPFTENGEKTMDAYLLQSNG
jgi:hypothetical protein